LRTVIIAIISLFASSTFAAAQGETVDNKLTPKEVEDGWILLFDGQTTDGWHTFNATGINPRWHVKAGELVLEPSPTRIISGADLETDDQFDDFEFSLEWKISPGGNSGIIYRVKGQGVDHPWEVGPEYQLLDNKSFDEPPSHQAGALWDFYAPVRDVTKPVGQFNHARIVVHKNHVEHWMNGVQLLHYQLGSEDFNARKAKSAYGSSWRFGTMPRGSIVLQDEGRLISFRNIKIRHLK
jgi:hypothetical protein